VKIWFQNHRYKTKKAQKDQDHAENRAAASDPVPTPADPALSPRKMAMPTLMKDVKMSSTEDDDDDWTRKPSTVDVLSSDQHDLSLPPSGLRFRPSPADLRPPDALGYPTSMYVGETQSSITPPMYHRAPMSADTDTVPGFPPGTADEYRAPRLQQVRPRSPADSAPSPFPAADIGLASVLYGHRDTSTAAAADGIGAPMGYYYPAYTAPTNTGSRSLASPLGYLPMNSLRSW